MTLPSTYPHHDLLEEYRSLDTAEERLSWLMERQTEHSELLPGEMTDEKRVPGCLSGLWLKGHVTEGACVFHARSESPMVNGVVTFLCELYSGLTPQEVLGIGAGIPSTLGLEALLSTTRKRAVASAASFFLSVASTNVEPAVAA